MLCITEIEIDVGFHKSDRVKLMKTFCYSYKYRFIIHSESYDLTRYAYQSIGQGNALITIIDVRVNW